MREPGAGSGRLCAACQLRHRWAAASLESRLLAGGAWRQRRSQRRLGARSGFLILQPRSLTAPASPIGRQ